MEQIETQASDLRFLTNAQVPPLSNSPSVTYETPRPASGPQASPGSASFGANSAQPGDTTGASAGKEKSTDDSLSSARQTRSKRNRYISIACNECKRRKIKCNGENPCKRCGNMGLNCLYTPNCCASTFKDSVEYKIVTSQLANLQDEVSHLKQAMQAMQTMQAGNSSDRSYMVSSTDRSMMGPGMLAQSPAPSSVSGRHTSVSQARTPSAYRGSTSTAHMLSLAQNTSGIPYQDPGDVSHAASERHMQPIGSGIDPILEYSRDEMIRLCKVHETEIGIMYPVLNMATVTEHAQNLATHLESFQQQLPTEYINDDKTLELKMVMCCALVVEEHGPSAKAQKLFDSMEPTLNRKLLADEAYLSILPLLCIFAGYRFLTDHEGLAWRVIGQVCRLCLELGLHRSQVHHAIQDPVERRNALNSFWSAYVLDRRWAFNTGLPYVIQDADVDPNLEYPNEHPYLVAMVSYSKLGAKVWSLVEQRRTSFLGNDKQWVQDIQRLDTEIGAWYSHVPPEVQIRDWHKDGQIQSTGSYNLQRLRVWTYLRKNQIRNWLFAPILHNTNTIMSAPHLAKVCVDVAKDTVAYLDFVNKQTTMIKTSRAFYSQFLVSALAIMFLASTQAPAQFSSVCREDFYTGLELIKDLSPESHISKRLWRIVWSLREYLQQLASRQNNDAHSNAALGIVSLSRGRMEPTATSYGYPNAPAPPGEGMALEGNGNRLTHEFVDIYEELVSHNGFRNIGATDDAQAAEQARFTAQNMFFGHITHMF